MTSKNDISKWLTDNLSSVLSFPVPPDFIDYIMAMENDNDIEEYLKTLLDISDPRHRQFVENYKIIRKGGKSKPIVIDMTGKTSPASYTKKTPEREEPEHINKKKSKNKMVSIDAKNFDLVLLKGRLKCTCQATKHRLINNCIKCGRIVCAQEGSGPCLFCGSLVCSNEEQDIINANNKLSKKLLQNLMRPEDESEIDAAAVRQRDRLLEYDRTSERRTKVIDDEGEYFSSTSVWLSPEERDKVKHKEEEVSSRKHAPRSQKKFTLDFAGREVQEDGGFDEDCYEDLLNTSTSTHIAHPGISEDLQPMFIASMRNQKKQPSTRNQELEPTALKPNRIQDKEFQEMSDVGACLSMHQPEASLLVKGIKKHEGRQWYTSHRGRLWIASTSKQPRQEDIDCCKEGYRDYYKVDNIPFPSSYPTGCLLGCVTLVDCLPQEEYRKKYPNGESECPFVFICEDPQMLDLQFPLKGKHKIYKLESKILHAAQKSLLRLAKERAHRAA